LSKRISRSTRPKPLGHPVNRQAASAEPEWMQGFGKLRRLRKETKRIQARIEKAFEVIEPEDRT
jgi:hypothetical protein